MKPARILISSMLFLFALSVLQAQQPAVKKDGDAEIVGLAHINIATKDLEKSLSFYQDLLHFAIVERSEMSAPAGTSKMALIKRGSCIIELSQPPNPETVLEKTRGTVGHFALDVSNLDKVAADLKAKGVKFDRDVTANDKLFGGAKIAFISGPSGESIEFFEFLNPARNPNAK